MKTIEIPDEMYDELAELAKEYVTQDSRCTAMPYLFQIQTTREVAAYDGCGETFWYSNEGDKIIDEKETIMELLECETEDEAEKKYNELDECDIDKMFEDNEYQQLNVTTENYYQNAFFTAKACKDHIKANHYHYNEPVDYLNCAWRSPEMDLICNLLKHLNQL